MKKAITTKKASSHYFHLSDPPIKGSLHKCASLHGIQLYSWMCRSNSREAVFLKDPEAMPQLVIAAANLGLQAQFTNHYITLPPQALVLQQTQLLNMAFHRRVSSQTLHETRGRILESIGEMSYCQSLAIKVKFYALNQLHHSTAIHRSENQICPVPSWQFPGIKAAISRLPKWPGSVSNSSYSQQLSAGLATFGWRHHCGITVSPVPFCPKQASEPPHASPWLEAKILVSLRSSQSLQCLHLSEVSSLSEIKSDIQCVRWFIQLFTARPLKVD